MQASCVVEVVELSVKAEAVRLAWEEGEIIEGGRRTVEDGKDVVLDVDSMVNVMEEKLASTRDRNYPHRSTIFRVPNDIGNNDAAAYSPKVVSIGLLQREKQRGLDEHKWHYLDKVLSRSKNNLKMYTKEMANIVVEAGLCYSGCPEPGGTMDWWFKDSVEKMLVDGCFIINLLLQLEDGLVEINDPIKSDRWTLPWVAHDMLLLENQLPFFVLEKLWELTGCKRPTLKTKVLHFFSNLLSSLLLEEDVPDQLPETEVHHLLHLIHLSLQPASPTKKPESQPRPLPRTVPTATELQEAGVKFHQPRPLPRTVPTATELQEAGVKFQQRKKARSFLDVTFEQGLMQLPRLTISDSTNSLFRNFIAFEQGFPNCGSHFTSYCIFMDSLINTPRDVQILKQSGIIAHVLGSDKEVALLFNNLSRGINWDYQNSYLHKVFKDVEDHTQKKWPTWRAKLVRDYFNNPWAILSLIAAIVILILTFLQTYFAVFAYFRPP